eukprot:CAMPEP_0171100456 /NCGR_PEP_ID=MMETSP0766_2-20121228/52973_1 /TAXON_ID=439317 /ORGANISM="Gambierdiscus australes, Strain CAWD 149" /LENGTH=52 /DNA_ID=CAMNT_0011560293 /DNA_START=456 /DNA_END=611 /DNA_ORIENTATION=+
MKPVAEPTFELAKKWRPLSLLLLPSGWLDDIAMPAAGLPVGAVGEPKSPCLS